MCLEAAERVFIALNKKTLTRRMLFLYECSIPCCYKYDKFKSNILKLHNSRHATLMFLFNVGLSKSKEKFENKKEI